MIRRRPDLLAIVVALIGTLAVAAAFLGDLLLSRESEIAAGERRVQEFGIMLGEHTARSFEAVDILLREIATDLSDKPPRLATLGFNAAAMNTSPSATRARCRSCATSSSSTAKACSASSRPTSRRPASTCATARTSSPSNRGRRQPPSAPMIGRNSGRYTYALARRIVDARRNFAGIAFAAIEPAYFQHFCWGNRLADDFESVIINAKGQVIASCRPTDLGKQVARRRHRRRRIRSTKGACAAGCRRTGVARGNGLIASLSPVPGFADLRVLTMIPTDTLLAGWRQRFLQLGTLFLLVSGMLVSGGLLVRRQIADLRTMADELAASRDQLEARVHAATVAISRQKDEAERANKAKSRFLAAASHDLRQPLHALSLFAADLQHRLRSGKPRRPAARG